MSARDDYPPKRYDQTQARQWEMMCDEIDRLRAEIEVGHDAIDEGFDRLEGWAAPMLAPRPVRYIAEPNPGSDEAYDLGCTCSREINNDGDGLVFGGFVVTPDCPIHDPEDDAA